MICPKCEKNEARYNTSEKVWEYCLDCSIKIREADIVSDMIDCGIPKECTVFSLKDFNQNKVALLRKQSKDWNTNIILEGDSFVGKTVLLSAICKEILCSTNKSVVFMNYISTSTKLGDYMEYPVLLEKALTSDLLVLDDLVNPIKDIEYRWLYTVLSERRTSNKVTFASSNSNLEKCLESRLYSRLIGSTGIYLYIDQSCWNKGE